MNISVSGTNLENELSSPNFKDAFSSSSFIPSSVQKKEWLIFSGKKY